MCRKQAALKTPIGFFGAACFFRARFDFDDLPCSDKATNPAVAVAGQEVDDRNLNHGVAARTLAHSCTSDTDKNLTRECRIVYRHVEFETLAVCLSRHSLAHHIHTMTDILERINALHGNDVCLV